MRTHAKINQKWPAQGQNKYEMNEQIIKVTEEIWRAKTNQFVIFLSDYFMF